MPMFTAHLLNETVLHGLDLARAAGRPWVVDPVHAELALRGFLVPVIHWMGDRLSRATTTAETRVVVDFHLRRAGLLRMRLEDGAIHVDDPADGGRVDAHVGADAATLLAFMWGRLSLAQAVLRGPMIMWGRAPWRSFALKRAIALP
jgi:hypothetical protein